MTAPDPRPAPTLPFGKPPAAPAWTTAGIRPVRRPGLATRAFMAVLSWAERLNVRCAIHGDPDVYDTAAFPWAAGIEQEWRAIRRELDEVMARRAALPNIQDISADAASITRDAGWKVFLLVAYGI